MVKQSEASERLEKLYQKAEKLYGTKGKQAQAIQAYNAYLEQAPDDATAWSELGTLYADRDDVANALLCFQRAIEAAPDNPKFWMRKATLLSDLNTSQNEAFSHLQHLRDAYKAHFADLHALREELVACYEKVIELEKGDAPSDRGGAMRRRARVLGEMGRHSEAIEAYEHLAQIEKNPQKKSKHLFAIALQYEALGEWAKALGYVDACLDGGESILLTHKARILQKAGREEQVAEIYDTFLETVEEKLAQTQDPAYAFQKATVLETLGRVDEALECLNGFLKRGKALTPRRKTQILERIKALMEHKKPQE